VCAGGACGAANNTRARWTRVHTVDLRQENRLFVGVREPVAVAGPASLLCVCCSPAVRSSMLSVCLRGVLTLVLHKLSIVSLSCSSTLHPMVLSLIKFNDFLKTIKLKL